MTNKEIFILLANAYYQNYAKSIEVYKVLSPFGITLEEEDNPLVRTTETLLEKLTNNKYITEFILDFFDDGYITFSYLYDDENGKERKVTCNSLEEMFDFITA